jgi:hypothetical protein
MTYLSTTTTSSTTTTVVADYQLIILDDGTRYRLYNNGSVIAFNGTVILASGGLTAFKALLLTWTVKRTVV